MKGLACLLAAAMASASSLLAVPASACGGCFHPEDQPAEQASVVTAHRMALSIAMDGAVLWDQVQYAGSPEEFAWVLPVKPGASLQVASDAWFETLDAATSTRVVPPAIECVVPGTNDSWVTEPYEGDHYRMQCQTAPAVGAALTGGCAADDVGTRQVLVEGREPGSEILEPPAPQPVSVVHSGSAGPYETVTIHSDVPGAASAWLVDHGFAIDADIAPVLEAYEQEGFDFIALRLLPEAGVQQMKPVRVHMPGSVTTLPLRMVAAGTGANVALTLFVVGEGRWAVANFPSAAHPEGVEWDFAMQMSNYSELRDAALAVRGGTSWLTSYAQLGALFRPLSNPVTGGQVTYTTPLATATTIADAFVSQALANGETAADCLGQFTAFAEATGKVVDVCDDSGCGLAGPDEIDARDLECGALTDLRAALLGMHPADVWVTRLESFLPRSALERDLELAPDEQQTAQNWLRADSYSNPPCEVVSARTQRSRVRHAGGLPTAVIVLLTGAALAMWRRRRA